MMLDCIIETTCQEDGIVILDHHYKLSDIPDFVEMLDPEPVIGVESAQCTLSALAGTQVPGLTHWVTSHDYHLAGLQS